MNLLYVTDRGQINQVVSDILKANEIAIDTETTSLDVFSANWLLLQIEANGNIYVLDIRRLEYETYHYIISLIKDSRKRILLHNAKFDLKIIYNNTGEMLTNIYDTMIAEVLIHQGIGKQYYSYKDLVNNYLGITLDKDVRETFFNYDGSITNDQINYSALDVQYLKDIKKIQVNILSGQKQSSTLQLESDLIPVVTSMELNGVRIDEDYWKILIQENITDLYGQKEKLFSSIIEKTKFNKFSNAYDLANTFSIPVKTKKGIAETQEKTTDLDLWFREHFNLNSPKQVLSMLNLCGVSTKKTNEKELNVYKGKSEIVDNLLLYREYEKKVTTYGENFLAEKHPLTNRYHFEYNQLGTYTGRFSVSRMQQIPRDQRYRRSFIARDDYLIISADFNQQEYRLAGALTGDRRIIESYLMGSDMHTATGGVVYKVNIKDVLPEQRQNAKSVNFAMLYDSTAQGLAFNLNMGLQEAEELLKLLKESYPTFIEYREEAKKIIWELKYSITPLGRKRYFANPEIYLDSDEHDRYKRKVMREGWNHCVDYKTMCLTKNGWKSGNDIKIGDEILTKNTTNNCLEWNPVLAITKDTACTVKFSHRNMSAVTTNEHRWLVDTKGGKKSIFKTTEELSKWGDDRIHRTGIWRGFPNLDWSYLELKLLGLILTDGAYKNKNGIRIYQTKPHISLMIDNLLIDINHHKNTNVNSHENVWDLHVSDFTKKVHTYFPEKTVTLDFIFSLSREQAKVLFDWMLLGDGNVGKQITFWAGSKERAEMFQILAYLVGYSSKIHSQEPRTLGGNICYFVTIQKRKRVQVTSKQMTDAGTRDVWCPTVKNGTFVVNRLGNIYITGNCIQGWGADITKISMNNIFYENIYGEYLRFYNQAHDEIDLEVKDEFSEEIAKFTEDCMLKAEQSQLGEIPAAVDYRILKYWAK